MSLHLGCDSSLPCNASVIDSKFAVNRSSIDRQHLVNYDIRSARVALGDPHLTLSNCIQTVHNGYNVID